MLVARHARASAAACALLTSTGTRVYTLRYMMCSVPAEPGTAAHHGGARKRDPELVALDVLPGPERLRQREPAQTAQPSSPPHGSGADPSCVSAHAEAPSGIHSALPSAVSSGRAKASAAGQQTVKNGSAAAATVRDVASWRVC